MNTIKKIVKNLNEEIRCAYINQDEKVDGLIYARDKIKNMKEYEQDELITDGYHTFDELYYHRMFLFSIICNTYKECAWKSWMHDDGTMYKDYFIVGVTTELGDYSYHYHKIYWDIFVVEELEKAPKWDGHKPSDINRLVDLLHSN